MITAASYLFLLPYTLGLFITLLAMPRVIERLTKRGIVVPDQYKRNKTMVPSRSGLIIFIILFAIFAVSPVVSTIEQLLRSVHAPMSSTPMLADFQPNTAANLVIIMYGVFGLMDDFFDLGKTAKAALPFFFALPIIPLIEYTIIRLPFDNMIDLSTKASLFGGDVKLQLFFLFIIVPVYVLVVANLINMHSGFNGLQTGLSTILLSFLLIKCAIVGSTDGLLGVSAVAGAALGLWWYDRYPSRAFVGNTGQLMIGAAIGVAIVRKGFLISGFVMLIPHTINFLLYVYWKIRRRMHPGNERYRKVKFGWVAERSGVLEVPNPYTLKWVLPYRYKMTERQATYAMYAVTLAFCVVGLFIDY